MTSREPSALEPTNVESSNVPALPELDAGVTRLRTDGRAGGALQSLVLDHVLLGDGTAVWVDARGNAATASLARLAPGRRTLERIRVARAFTAFQHHGLLEDLPGAVGEDTALVVAPAVDWFYANDDLREGEGEAMLAAGLERLRGLAADRDVPVLLSDAGTDLAGRLEAHCDAELACTATRFGPRFSGEGFETLLFDRGDGGVQTTLAFWRRVLERRHPAPAPGATGVRPVGSH